MNSISTKNSQRFFFYQLKATNSFLLNWSLYEQWTYFNMATHYTVVFTHSFTAYTQTRQCHMVVFECMTMFVCAFECVRKHVEELLIQQNKRKTDCVLVNPCLKYILNKCWFNFFNPIVWLVTVLDVQFVWNLIKPMLGNISQHTCSNKHILLTKEMKYLIF